MKHDTRLAIADGLDELELARRIAELDREACRVSWDCPTCYPGDVPDPYCRHARPLLDEMDVLIRLASGARRL